jgi:hypothetical protein
MITAFLIIIAAILNAAMDLVSVKFQISIFSEWKSLAWFCDGNLSWKNKWKNGDSKQGERFLGSSTFLVWTTDLWHLLKTLMLICFYLGIVMYEPLVNPVADFFIFYFGFGFIFTLFYDKVFRLK